MKRVTKAILIAVAGVAVLAVIERHDYRAALKAVTAPVLVVHGAGDLQPETASRMYAEVFPNARFEVIANATHFPFEEQPTAFETIVGEFLASLR